MLYKIENSLPILQCKIFHSLTFLCPFLSHQSSLLPWCRHQMEKSPRYWSFVTGIHRSPVDSPHKGQWRGALRVFFICTRINGWANTWDAGDLRHHRAHSDVIVIPWDHLQHSKTKMNSLMLLFVVILKPAVIHQIHWDFTTDDISKFDNIKRVNNCKASTHTKLVEKNCKLIMSIALA